jgi:hypothetical protein
MTVVGSCRPVSQYVLRLQPTCCRTLPSNKIVQRLKRRLREERERRRAAESRVAQLEAALEMEQGGTSRTVDLPDEPPRPFCRDRDYLFSHKSNYHNRGHQALHEVIRRFGASYTSIAGNNGKQAMRLSLLQKFRQNGGRFYQWNREMEAAVEVDMDEALHLSGPVFSSSLRGIRETQTRLDGISAKNAKHRGKIRPRR